MLKTWLSGDAAKAIVKDDSQYFLMTLDEDPKPIEFHYAAGVITSFGPFVIVNAESVGEIRYELRKDLIRVRIDNMISIIRNNMLDEELKIEAAECLVNLLKGIIE
jgi:hypothetical protein